MSPEPGGAAAEFERGLAAALDPQPDAGTDGAQTTNLTSRWHTTFCPTCGHTFRRGDRVDVDGHTVRHLDPVLGCGVPLATAAAAAAVAAFADGIREIWSTERDVRRVEDEPHLIAPPFAGFRRPVCLFCAHTFRPGELVIVCPCRPHERRCARAVHRDPARGLVCWESWRPGSHVKVCPVTLTRLDGPA